MTAFNKNGTQPLIEIVREGSTEGLKTVYVEDAPYSVVVTFPMVSENSYAVSHTTAVAGGRNANGDFIGAVQNEKIVISLDWSMLTPAQWKTVVNTASQMFCCRVKYFSDEADGFRVKTFYFGDRAASPHYYDSLSGEIDFYQNCKVSLIEV